MNSRISQRVLKLAESETLKMARLARDLQDRGYDVINLSLGEPDFDTPEFIKEAAKVALDEGYTKYSPVPGLAELRLAIVDKFQRDNSLNFNMEQIVVSNGAKQSINNLCYALLDPGDEVVVFTPYWVSYIDIIKLAGAKPKVLSAGIDQDYKPSAAQLRQVMTQGTKFVLFSSPCNPTGSVFTRAELASYVEVLKDFPDCYIVSDEIYEYINFTDKHISIGQFEEVQDRVIIVNGFSKGFAMTGWRLGYMAAPQAIAQACTKIQSQCTSGANTFGQRAAIAAILSDLSAAQEMKDVYLKRRNMMHDALNSIEGFHANMPKGAFYFFPDVSALFGKSDGDKIINDASDLCTYLLEKAFVSTVNGNAFGAPNCIRLSYVDNEENLMEAIERIKLAVSKLS